MSRILCKAKMKKGTRCQNNPKPNSEFCKVHQSSKPTEVPPPTEPEETIYIDHSELDMGELSVHFPNEIIYEMLKYLNVFELTDFSMLNRSCYRFVKVYRMIG